MSELFVPIKLQDRVRFEPVTDAQGKKVGHGVYNPNTDIISLDPESATKAVFCEELYHRKQHQLLVANGLYPAPRIHDLFYTEAEEIGIRPTIREIAIRDNSLEMAGDISAEYIRYFENAANFAYIHSSIDQVIRDRFIEIVRGNRLFDGMQAVLEFMEKGFTHAHFNFMTTFQDEYGEKEVWDKVNEARKRW